MVNKREVFAAIIKEPEIRFCIGVIVAFALLMANRRTTKPAA